MIRLQSVLNLLLLGIIHLEIIFRDKTAPLPIKSIVFVLVSNRYLIWNMLLFKTISTYYNVCYVVCSMCLLLYLLITVFTLSTKS